ncbi:MAG TPA: TonB-dependent receptor [Rudaea sp.]|nr:TonB-dependent receptor [Rudaea sp.]
MKFKPNLLAVAVASVLVGGFCTSRAARAEDGGAVAKTAPAQPDGTPGNTATPNGEDIASAAKPGDQSTINLGEITVTGVRAGIEEAISVKKNSNEIVEAISAEDIGKLPDNSIADSLARLPGITAQRVNGVESLVSIRGFSGDFNGTLLNGREQVSTGDNRAVDFSQYPSELLSGLVVYKTPEASLVGQGISGTIDLQTVRPLDFDHRVVQVGARGESTSNGSLNQDTDSKGYRVNASYIDQFADHTFGIAVAVARLYSPVQDERWEAYGYTTTSATGSAQALGGGKAYADSVEGTRDAIMSTLQWQPNAQYASTLDLYYSKFDQDTTFRGFEACTAFCGSAIANPVITGNVVTGGVFQNVGPVLRDELDTHNDKIYSYGWNNKFHFADHWTATADLSYGKADSSQSFLEEYAGYVGVKDNFAFSFNPSTGLPHLSPGLTYSDPNVIKLTDPGGWGQDGYLKFPKTTDKLKAVRFDLARDINSWVSKVDVGINYNERTKTRNSDEWFLDLPGGDNLPNGTKNSAAIPSNCLVGPTYLGYVGFPSTVAWDLNCVLPLYQQIPNYNGDITAKDWKVREKVGTGYVKADIDTDIAGMPLRGNVGGQYIHTDQSSDAFATLGQATTHGGISYKNFLPSMNLVLTLPDDEALRFGAGKEMARPRLDEERASIEPSVSVPPPNGATGTTCAPTGVTCLWTAKGGNPELKPFIADAYDLSWEKYWDTKAYVQVDYWFKELKTYIYNQTFVYDFTGIPNPSNLTPASNLGLFTRPANGTGGFMRGYELVASMPFDILWSPLDGFGVQASYAVSDSSINPNGPGTSPSPFPGLSKYVSQATFYYEKMGFSARVAATHRSDFLGEIQAFGADQSFVNIRAETVTDLQLSYEIQEGSFKGVYFIFQINNLFNEPYRQFNGVHTQPEQYTVYGRQTLLGINYKF